MRSKKYENPTYLNGNPVPSRSGYRRTHIIHVDSDGIMRDKVTMTRSLDFAEGGRGGFSLTILRFILLFLVVVALFDFANGSDRYVTFSSFLQALSEAPKLDTSWIRGVGFTLGDWGIFNVFRNFINSLLSIVRMGLYMAVGVGQLIIFVGFLLSSFFMV